MRLPTLAVGSAVTILALSGLAASTASATPATGTSRTEFVDGILKPGVVRADGIKLKTKEDSTVRTFTLTYDVGGESGWHEHPGIVIAVVKSGVVDRKLGCKRAERFTAGQAFTEVGPHFVSNPGNVPAVLEITAIFPTDLTDEFRRDLDKPKCHSRS